MVLGSDLPKCPLDFFRLHCSQLHKENEMPNTANRAVSPLMKVPVWVWLFIAAIQVLSFTNGVYYIFYLDKAIREVSASGITTVSDGMRMQRQRDVALTNILWPLYLGLLSLGLAYWKWSSTHPGTRQFSLRTLLIVMTLACLALGGIAYLMH